MEEVDEGELKEESRKTLLSSLDCFDGDPNNVEVFDDDDDVLSLSPPVDHRGALNEEVDVVVVVVASPVVCASSAFVALA